MEHVLDKIEQLSATLRSLQPISKEDQQKLNKKFRLEFNFNSNHLEGNTLTYTETELLLVFDDTRGNHSMREYEEMKAHDVAYQLVEEWAKDQERPLTEQAIKNLNEIILVRPFWKEAITPDGQKTKRLIQIGNYKEHPNSVLLPNGEMFHYASPIDTPILMQELTEWYHDEENGLHAVTLSAMLHYRFVRIHPFDDGNGRIARLLMNYVLLRNGLPPVIIKTADKVNYLRALHLADVGDYAPFIQYIGEQLIWSLETTIKATKGESIDEPTDLDKKITLLERELQGVDPNEEIQKEFSKEVLFEIYDSWFTDLMHKAVPVIQKFNRFFTGNRHWLSIQNGMGSIQFLNESSSEILAKLKEDSKRGADRVSSHDCKIVLQTAYGPFIKGGLNSFGCNYGFEIKFGQIKYEVFLDHFSDSNKKQERLFERLLHKPVTDVEIDEIVKQLGDTIFEHIDYHTKKNGLR
ncbi:MAG: Fic family protein [Cyclobacteriaceae bacterium]|nr:Fic family protein [Cyclobacteriaceae bacterium]